MSNIKNSGLDQYGAEPFEQQQFGTAGIEGVNDSFSEKFTTNGIIKSRLIQLLTMPSCGRCKTECKKFPMSKHVQPKTIL